MNKPTTDQIFELVMKMSPIEITETFARELSCDPIALTQICAELSAYRPEVKNGSSQDALASMLVELLTEQIVFEIVISAAGKNNFKVKFYPFGVDRPIFSFSLQCFGMNPTLTACVLCMTRDGREREAEKFFKDRTSPPDRSKVMYKGFLYNDLFSRHFFRGPLWLHFISVFISGVSIYLGSQYPDLEVALRATVLLDRVISDVDSRLTQMLQRHPNSMPWVTDQIRRIVSTLNNSEKTFENVTNLFSVEITKHIESYIPLIK